ncbi:hypothetical protein F2P79_005864 [Pimephales promelas]|nr:hypothetical protein F2P79_005864 [Pimephales promelas]
MSMKDKSWNVNRGWGRNVTWSVKILAKSLKVKHWNMIFSGGEHPNRDKSTNYMKGKDPQTCHNRIKAADSPRIHMITGNLVEDFSLAAITSGSYREQTRSEEGARGSDGIGADLKLGLY